MNEEIVRIAAKGDGVTETGRHVSGAVPGDILLEDGALERGAHYVDPPCQHFSRCGGCQLQQADEDALRDFVTQRVLGALEGQGLEPVEVLPTHLSPPHSRRRATLHAMRTHKGAVIGFREAGSHTIVDLRECLVLRKELTEQIQPLRGLISKCAGKGAVDIGMALCDQGVDLSLTNVALDNLEATEATLDYAREHQLARLSIDQGFGPETVWEPEPVTISMPGLPVAMPVGAFLQATCDAEDVMIADAREWLDGASPVADLFAGLGTFTFGLTKGRKVLAVEAERATHLACKNAAGRTGGRAFAIHRDLFRNPLQPEELNKFGGVLLDPPRAGAKAQIAQIAASTVANVVYVSCNPSSWARDAAKLIEAGFRLQKLRPVGQFRWSTHVELTSQFTR
ncbi:MAG: class I SAM-dependent RNA methyltransferase [Pseudomonadota bacterium]|nr:class I SAM-dependent RNA methyltransferase [Pseudomonadota bacterium]